MFIAMSKKNMRTRLLSTSWYLPAQVSSPVAYFSPNILYHVWGCFMNTVNRIAHVLRGPQCLKFSQRESLYLVSTAGYKNKRFPRSIVTLWFPKGPKIHSMMSLHLLGTLVFFLMLSTHWNWPARYKLWTSGMIPTAHLSASSDLYQEKSWILQSELENMKAQLFLAAETFAFEPAAPFMNIFLNPFS